MNDLVEIYVFWLEQFKKRTEDTELKKLTRELITSLQNKKSIHELHSQIDNTLTLVKNISPKNQLAKQLEEWNANLNQCKEAHFFVSQIFPKLIFVGKTLPLKQLLEDILNSEHFLLHNRALSLLMALSSDNLQENLNYLNQTPLAKPIAAARCGSFGYGAPLSQEHGFCVDLLTSNAVGFDSHNQKQISLNNLLQTALLIYVDIHKKAQMPVKSTSSSFCMLI